MLHEMRNRGDYTSARSLRSVFTDYKQSGESWDIGGNQRYTALNPIQLSAITKKKEIEILGYFNDSDNDDFYTPRFEDEQRVYNGDDGCRNTS